MIYIRTTTLTLIACCMNSIAISRPNNSPATRVNLLIMEQAPKIDSMSRSNAVQTHTLQDLMMKEVEVVSKQYWKKNLKYMYTAGQKTKNCERTHHPDQAIKRFRPKSALSLAKLNINVYIMTVGSATPNISNGWPPMIECIIPQRAVDANVWTAVSTPSAWDLFIYLYAVQWIW